ncbi:MAG: ribulose-phosphate 3-epimerase [Bacteroidales bacterium]|nr:ribulose-phosphate 3-epimerase [Bacteroidales bacterium]
MSRQVSPSILAADLGSLRTEVEKINKSKATWLHCDIMDGVFVPNISFGIPVISQVSNFSEKPLDVHLMMIHPENFIDKFHEAGAKNLTIHYEVCHHLQKNIAQIKELGMSAGISLTPHTPIHLLEEIIQDIDILLIMSVNPGFGGQKLIENTYAKVGRAKELILRKNCNTLIQVDGGVTQDNAGKLYDAGVDILVAGTTVFAAEDPAKAVDDLLNA